MRKLVDIAISAHGGWNRWKDVQKVHSKARINGATWAAHSVEGVLSNVEVTVDTRRQRTVYEPFKKDGQRGMWEPGVTGIVADNGQIIQSEPTDMHAFDGMNLHSPWENRHVLYFAGYAMWNYLTTPFLFRWPGVETQEIEPWQTNGETWRRLAVTFPDSFITHSREQIFYFGEDGLLRRHDYLPVATKAPPAAHYVRNWRIIEGIIFPTSRRVYARGPENKPLIDRVAISIELDEIVLIK